MKLYERLLFNKKFSGMLWSIIFMALLIGVVLFVLTPIFRDTPTWWYVFGIMLRIVLGMCGLLTVKKIYGRSVRNVFTVKNGKAAGIAGIGFILYFVYDVIYVCLVGETFHNLDLLTFILIMLLSLSIAFFEEIVCRVLFYEGYFHGERGLRNKLLYVSINFFVFSIPHLFNSADLRTLLHTGIMGLALSVMYVKSRNILVPMVLHFLFDALTYLTMYISSNGSLIAEMWISVREVMYGVMFVLSFGILLKKENEIVEETDVSQIGY